MKTKLVAISALMAGFLSVGAFAEDTQPQMNGQMEQQPAAPVEPAMPSNAQNPSMQPSQQGATPDVAPPGNADDMTAPAAPAAPAPSNNY